MTKTNASTNKGKKQAPVPGGGAGGSEYKGRMATFKLDRKEQRSVLREQAQAQTRSRK